MSALHKLLYRRIIFCHRCRRSMFVGVNIRYACHLVRHTGINKLLILVAAVVLISFYPSSISIMSARKVGHANYVSEEQILRERIVQSVLKRHSNIGSEKISELTKIILRHATEKKLDPKLVAAIVVVESHGNSVAISESKSVGIMQIHVPTWKSVVDFAEKNPFDPDVNIDIGTTILADYLKRYGDLESALAAYEGSRDLAESEYPAKVLEVYQSGVP